MSSQVEWVAPSVAELVEIFDERAKDLKFPDLDAQVLRQSVTEVEHAAAEVQRLEAELERARELLSTKQDALVARSQRALAYARVFAEEDPALSERLAKVLLPRSRKPALPKAEPGVGAVEEPAVASPPRKRRTSRESSQTLFTESASEAAPS